MSMNLIFDVIGSPAIVDFPFQTPTELTYSVLKEKDLGRRLVLIKEYVDTWPNYSQEDKDRILAEVEALLRSPTLELSLI